MVKAQVLLLCPSISPRCVRISEAIFAQLCTWLAALCLLVAIGIGNCWASPSAFLPAATHHRHHFSETVLNLKFVWFLSKRQKWSKSISQIYRIGGHTNYTSLFSKVFKLRQEKKNLYLKTKFWNVLWKLRILKVSKEPGRTIFFASLRFGNGNTKLNHVFQGLLWLILCHFLLHTKVYISIKIVVFLW